uniref:Uncharacterized protein n=1 Tax=Ananas comosus var. bracteatus TaxID=296719 RepID=A0A6V7P2G7_ANACO|nr:unnamed protein product [Ananas comosus var. bracteatus]
MSGGGERTASIPPPAPRAVDDVAIGGPTSHPNLWLHRKLCDLIDECAPALIFSSSSVGSRIEGTDEEEVGNKIIGKWRESKGEREKFGERPEAWKRENHEGTDQTRC